MTDRERLRVIGLGSRMRRDDGIGPALVDRLGAAHPEIDARVASADPMTLANALEGARAVVIVDAARGGGAPGDILRFELGRDALPDDPPPSSTHAASLADALAFARAIDHLPKRVVVYAVVGRCFDMGDGLDPAVAAALDALMRRVLSEVNAIVDTSGPVSSD